MTTRPAVKPAILFRHRPNRENVVAAFRNRDGQPGQVVFDFESPAQFRKFANRRLELLEQLTGDVFKQFADKLFPNQAVAKSVDPEDPSGKFTQLAISRAQLRFISTHPKQVATAMKKLQATGVIPRGTAVAADLAKRYMGIAHYLLNEKDKNGVALFDAFDIASSKTRRSTPVRNQVLLAEDIRNLMLSSRFDP